MRVMHKGLGLGLLLAACVWQSQAQAEQWLTAAEIRAVMGGNSISGDNGGKLYRQNNHLDGIAVVNYDQVIYNIPWIANDRDEYCEDWGEWGWLCFKMAKLGNNKIKSKRVKPDDGKENISDWSAGFIDINTPPASK